MIKSRILKKSSAILFTVMLFIITGCDDDRVTDFGFTGKISGKIVDQSGRIISGDTTADNLTVVALGELDTEPMRIRVLGDGTYTNQHLYPQKYTVWVEGAFLPVSEVTVDLKGEAITHDFTVTPFISVAVPIVEGSPSATEVTVKYEYTPTDGYVPEERVVYVSTVNYPSQATGSGAYWQTIRQELTEDMGTTTITGLKPETRYFIRGGARANGTTRWNLSDQIEIKTP